MTVGAASLIDDATKFSVARLRDKHIMRWPLCISEDGNDGRSSVKKKVSNTLLHLPNYPRY